MNKIFKLAVSALCFASAGALAAPIYDYADVVAVQEVFEPVNRPVERCRVETTARPATTPSPLGAVLGAGIGGVAGHQFGKGHGKDWATAAGAVAGALIGNGVAEDRARGGADEAKRCWTEDNWVRVSRGYDVSYRYGGRVLTTRMDHDPGRQVEVEVSVRPTGR